MPDGGDTIPLNLPLSSEKVSKYTFLLVILVAD